MTPPVALTPGEEFEEHLRTLQQMHFMLDRGGCRPAAQSALPASDGEPRERRGDAIPRFVRTGPNPLNRKDIVNG